MKLNAKELRRLEAVRKAEAEAYAKRLGDGLPQKAAGTRIHSPHIELRYDEAAMTKRDNLYTEFRGYRRG